MEIGLLPNPGWVEARRYFFQPWRTSPTKSLENTGWRTYRIPLNKFVEETTGNPLAKYGDIKGKPINFDFKNTGSMGKTQMWVSQI